ncbi:zinc finger BED domain-containing protein 4-like [Notolabrus celidotus]|uniref:zinc finger BED domain-containing protein 4-like n=1 Tax=Notolabrus celidotus TaxID=1203425 RepID=UPI00148FBD3C|nr:zinc finger BED domain-containing protein 4-like [Notolabrus celidotus]
MLYLKSKILHRPSDLAFGTTLGFELSMTLMESESWTKTQQYVDLAAGTTEATTAAETQAADSSDSSSASPPEKKKSAMKELFGEWFMAQEPRTRSADEVAEEEMNLYRLADCIPTDGNPLRWWKKHHSSYPHLAMLAQPYLAVPGTSVPSERVFSTAGDIVTASRSVLSAENVDILIFLKKNLKIE